jgi:CDP-diacylglycerol--glycerol-3-phosphate 3-phosphatidyltransferase
MQEMSEQKKEVPEVNNNDTPINNKNKPNKLNLPNKLTLFRIILVPVYMVFILLPNYPVFSEAWSNMFAAALVLIAALTDLLDGFLARRLKLITDFGKLMDPISDKFMVVGALIAITASSSFENIRLFAAWAVTIVFLRELAVTSIRLVAKTADDTVIAANFAAKIKTFSQVVCIMTILLEDIVLTANLHTRPYLFSYITMGVMIILTVYSGIVYFKSYWKYIDPVK